MKASAGSSHAWPIFNSISVAPLTRHQSTGISQKIAGARHASSTPRVATTVGSGTMPKTSAWRHSPLSRASASKG